MRLRLLDTVAAIAIDTPPSYPFQVISQPIQVKHDPSTVDRSADLRTSIVKSEYVELVLDALFSKIITLTVFTYGLRGHILFTELFAKTRERAKGCALLFPMIRKPHDTHRNNHDHISTTHGVSTGHTGRSL